MSVSTTERRKTVTDMAWAPQSDRLGLSHGKFIEYLASEGAVLCYDSGEPIENDTRALEVNHAVFVTIRDSLERSGDYVNASFSKIVRNPVQSETAAQKGLDVYRGFQSEAAMDDAIAKTMRQFQQSDDLGMGG